MSIQDDLGQGVGRNYSTPPSTPEGADAVVGRSAKRKIGQGSPLTMDGSYSCPACGSGEVNAIALMDVFACSFCRHLFTVNLQTQSLQMADSLQPMAWKWTGWRWRAAHQSETSAALVWAFSAVLSCLPVVLISLSNYIFPPTGGLRFVLIWIGLTWISHSLMSFWLLAEFHRWPWYISARIRLQRWRAG
ncbi:MAG: hypothetical protein AAFU53_17050 [Cyanobacteria bacterium J06632_3]